MGLSQDIADARLEIRSALSGLDRPTAIEFLGPKNNDLFVLEKNSGQAKRFAPTGSSVVLDLPVDSASHHGLLGLALDPSSPLN